MLPSLGYLLFIRIKDVWENQLFGTVNFYPDQHLFRGSMKTSTIYFGLLIDKPIGAMVTIIHSNNNIYQ